MTALSLPLTSSGADQVSPQLVERDVMILPFSYQVAASTLPPTLATTGNRPCRETLAGATTGWIVQVRPPLVDLANDTPSGAPARTAPVAALPPWTAKITPTL